MKRHIITACLYTVITAVLLGIAYPLAIMGIARLAFSTQASGELIQSNGVLIGSRLIGQSFTGPEYFHSRPRMQGTDTTQPHRRVRILDPPARLWCSASRRA